MGRMLGRRWADAGCDVASLDPDSERGGMPVFSHEALEQAVPHVAAIVLCVPVGAMQSVLESVCPLLSPRHILMDITSVKCLPMQWMEAAFAGAVVGAHPLFGPEPKPDENRVALVRGLRVSDAQMAEAERLFQAIDCATFRCTAQEHDRAAALVQSLNFAASAAYFATLAGHPGISDFATPALRRYAEAARKLLTSDAAMFSEFSLANPYFEESVREYAEQVCRTGTKQLSALADQAAIWYARTLS